MSEWISIKRCLPSDGQTVAVCDESDCVGITMFYDSSGFLGNHGDHIEGIIYNQIWPLDFHKCDVHYWMPLPTPPKEKT